MTLRVYFKLFIYVKVGGRYDETNVGNKKIIEVCIKLWSSQSQYYCIMCLLFDETYTAYWHKLYFLADNNILS